MNVVLIGDISIQNVAIRKVLASELEVEIVQIEPEKLENEGSGSENKKFDLSLVDLLSFSESPGVCIKNILSKNIAGYLIAIHAFVSDQLIQSILEAGADYEFSMYSETNVLVDMISGLQGT